MKTKPFPPLNLRPVALALAAITGVLLIAQQIRYFNGLSAGYLTKPDSTIIYTLINTVLIAVFIATFFIKSKIKNTLLLAASAGLLLISLPQLLLALGNSLYTYGNKPFELLSMTLPSILLGGMGFAVIYNKKLALLPRIIAFSAIGLLLILHFFAGSRKMVAIDLSWNFYAYSLYVVQYILLIIASLLQHESTGKETPAAEAQAQIKQTLYDKIPSRLITVLRLQP